MGQGSRARKDLFRFAVQRVLLGSDQAFTQCIFRCLAALQLAVVVSALFGQLVSVCLELFQTGQVGVVLIEPLLRSVPTLPTIATHPLVIDRQIV